jgi:hypothetical protein
VKINFASETLPLDRFANAAQVTLLQSHANRTSANATPASAPAPAPAAGNAPPPATPAAGAAP